MSNNVKIGLYLLLTLGACLFGFLGRRHYDRLMKGVQESSKMAADAPANEEKPAPPAAYGGYSTTMTYGVLFFIMVVGLGLMIGHDVSQYFGNRAVRVLYNDEGVGMRDADYDVAEQVWADGNHLEAIRLMREYLEKNPKEQHVALRIAEIYEKDLQNYLAAALEYEDVLNHSLPRERWAWAAIHLCNLYLRLNHQDKMIDLLRRVDSEYGETQAAEKARKRLALLGIETSGGIASGAEGDAPIDEGGHA
jgi:tetratricopeptide (TPR) repeat protein